MLVAIDGYVTPLPKKNIAKYTEASKKAGKVMLKYGALEYVDCIGDDVPDGKVTSFPMAMEDASFKDPSMMPFDGKRLIFGGFKPVVIAKKKL